MRPDNHLLRAADDGLDVVRGIFTALTLSAVLLALGSLIGAALFGNP